MSHVNRCSGERDTLLASFCVFFTQRRKAAEISLVPTFVIRCNKLYLAKRQHLNKSHIPRSSLYIKPATAQPLKWRKWQHGVLEQLQNIVFLHIFFLNTSMLCLFSNLLSLAPEKRFQSRNAWSYLLSTLCLLVSCFSELSRGLATLWAIERKPS